MTQKDLDLPMQANDASAKTIREYFKALLSTLIQEGEGFSGKRPFGNSGWEYELYAALVKHDIIKGSFDEHGYLDEVDSKMADKELQELIKLL